MKRHVRESGDVHGDHEITPPFHQVSGPFHVGEPGIRFSDQQPRSTVGLLGPGPLAPRINCIQAVKHSSIFSNWFEFVVWLPWSYSTLGGFSILAASVRVSACVAGIKFLTVLSGSEWIPPPQNYPGHSMPIYSFLRTPRLLAFTPSSLSQNWR